MQEEEEKQKRKSNAAKWTNHKLKYSGLYLVRGRHRYMKFNCTIMLVSIEDSKVYLNSWHKGFNLDKMFHAEFLGPFDEKEDMVNARERESKRHNC